MLRNLISRFIYYHKILIFITLFHCQLNVKFIASISKKLFIIVISRFFFENAVDIKILFEWNAVSLLKMWFVFKK